MPRSSLFRYSLRTLLLLLLVACMALGWFSIRLAKAREQAVAVAKLRHLGATVYYDFHHYYDENGDGCLNESRRPTDWKVARKLLSDDFFNNVYYVRFIKHEHFPQSGPIIHYLGPRHVRTPISRDANSYIFILESLPHLHTLDLSHSNAAGQAIPKLTKLSCLKRLALGDSLMSEEGAERLRDALPDCHISWR